MKIRIREEVTILPVTLDRLVASVHTFYIHTVVYEYDENCFYICQ